MTDECRPSIRVAIASYDKGFLRAGRRFLAGARVADFPDCGIYQTGEDLLDALQGGAQYEAILLDSRLEDMTAGELYAQMSALELPQRPHILLLSGGERAVPGSAPGPESQRVIHAGSLASLLLELQDCQRSLPFSAESALRWLYAEWGLQPGDTSCGYLSDAVFLVLQSDQRLAIRKDVLRQVSERHHVSVSAIDSGIRRLIVRLNERNSPAWQRFRSQSAALRGKVTTGKLIYSIKLYLLYLQDAAAARAEGDSQIDERESQFI